MKPVYMINGFLESGKTEFIKYTLQQPYFQVKGTTLLFLCEEGEVEYDEQILKNSRTEIELIENEEDFNPEHLTELEKKHKPERIIIEFNGMWNPKNIKLPFFWSLEQQITTINAATFPTYYTNMKSLVAEQVRNSEMIIFNRCDGLDEELAVYRRNIKAVNQKAEIIFEDAQGEISTIFEDDLPFDLKQDEIDLTEEGYGIWYLDALDHLDRYVGKKITYLAQVMIPKDSPNGYFVPGRQVMTCCAEDIAFLGFACKYNKVSELQNRQWVKVKAEVKKEYWEDYKQVGPVLYAISVEPAKAPKEEVLSFV
ncbi:MAG: GTPase [Lachnospiraceae bacterium]|nr:GTPase [Lachnospiraceae bacterium]MBP5298945.1 GTPase [Lachnospiraceae bacterium]